MAHSRFLQFRKIALYALLLLPKIVWAQTSFPTPMPITTEEAGTRPNNVYGSKLIYQTIHGKPVLVMYYGGWYRTDPEAPPNDSIYRAVCATPSSCGTGQKVIDPVASGMGAASMVNNPTVVEVHNAGQDYFIMYMTGVTGASPNDGYIIPNNKIYYSTSFATDGINWSVPRLLLDNAWLPSAVVGRGRRRDAVRQHEQQQQPKFPLPLQSWPQRGRANLE